MRPHPFDTARRALSVLVLPLLLVGTVCTGSDPGGPKPPGTGGAGGGDGGSGGSGGGFGGSGGSPGFGGSGGGGAGNGGSGGATPGAGGGGGGAGGRGGTGGGGTDARTPDAPPVTPPPDGGMTPPTMPPPTTEDPMPPCKRTVNVPNSGALGGALGDAQAGDCLVLADGEYSFPTITAKGTAEAPIVVKAANTLKVTVGSGNVALQGAAYVVVQGVHFRSSGSIRMGDCDHCRISRFRVQRMETGGEVDWITVSGTSKYCRIDHNDIGPQRSVGNMIMISGAGSQIVQYTRIDHNYFHDVTYGGGNGWELIRNGLSGWTFSKAFSTIEQNLFVKADSDPETISIKSSDNIIRYNTMRGTKGQFTLRHGNRTQVYGNYILGDGVSGSTGLRVYGGDHRIFNNYFAGLSGAAINIDSGSSTDDSGALTDHKVTYNVQVLFNTVVDGRISVGSGKPLPPRNITVGYNLIQGSGGISAVGGAQVRYVGNISSGGGTGAMMANPGLVKMGDIFRITMASPAVDAADGMFPFVTDDINGKPRNKPDIGAEELSSAAAKFGLLTEADVGPMAP